MSDLVENPKDWLSRVAAHLVSVSVSAQNDKFM